MTLKGTFHLLSATKHEHSNTIHTKCMLYEPVRLLHSPANTYSRVISALSLFHYRFLSDRKQIKVSPVSGTKAIFMLKVTEKHSNVREKIIMVPFGWTPMSHMRTQRVSSERRWFLKAIRYIFMLFAQLHICHKILEIDSKPLPRG